LYGLTGTDYSTFYSNVRSELTAMFTKYDAKFSAVKQQRSTPTTSITGKRNQQWSWIYGSENEYTPPITPPNLSRGTSTSELLHAASSGACISSVDSELSSYLDSDTLQKFEDDFNLLNRWHEHKLAFPVLSIIARDVILVPVSTVSFEFAFRLCGRIIEERQRRLALEMVEMLLCIKDWELGDARAQHSAQDKELEDAFEGLYLDEVEQPKT
jgi:hypothetical protein